MRRIPGFVLSLLLLLAFCAAIVAAGHPPGAAPDPMLVEIHAFVDAAQREVDVLETRFRAAGSEDEALDIQREIAGRKLLIERGVLEIELRYALSRGRTETADRLTRALDRWGGAR